MAYRPCHWFQELDEYSAVGDELFADLPRPYRMPLVPNLFAAGRWPPASRVPVQPRAPYRAPQRGQSQRRPSPVQAGAFNRIPANFKSRSRFSGTSRFAAARAPAPARTLQRDQLQRRPSLAQAAASRRLPAKFSPISRTSGPRTATNRRAAAAAKAKPTTSRSARTPKTAKSLFAPKVSPKSPAKAVARPTATISHTIGPMPASGAQNLLLAKLSDLMYRGPPPRSVAYGGRCWPITVIDTATEDSFLSWVFYMPALQAVVVTFRGSKNVQNFLTNLAFGKSTCSLGGMQCGQLHRGFLNLWLSHRAKVFAAVQKAARQYKSSRLYVTGHSLGGAVATIAALDFANAFRAPSSSIKRIHLCTMGSPRVGDSTFVSQFSRFASILSMVRYQQYGTATGRTKIDPVTAVPPEWLKFRHVGATTSLQCTQCNAVNIDPIAAMFQLHDSKNYLASFERLLGKMPVC